VSRAGTRRPRVLPTHSSGNWGRSRRSRPSRQECSKSPALKCCLGRLASVNRSGNQRPGRSWRPRLLGRSCASRGVFPALDGRSGADRSRGTGSTRSRKEECGLHSPRNHAADRAPGRDRPGGAEVAPAHRAVAPGFGSRPRRLARGRLNRRERRGNRDARLCRKESRGNHGPRNHTTEDIAAVSEHKTLIGYARVSIPAQDLALQLDALERASCDRVDKDVGSGTIRRRPQLDACLDYLRPRLQ
jgi:Resolvase, N terminal domain